jgi:outer membrane murein-binding lipoprotein Lpp
MVKLRKVTAIAAVVLGSLTVTGVALADDRQPQRNPGDHRAFCERLAQAAEDVRAKIGQIQAVQERIRQKIASGELTRRQEARAKHALRKLEALQDELEDRLERMLEIYDENCTR